ncbi:MAG: hypothetical protein ACNA8L_06315 [Luteolibacter sp.]
MSNKPHAKPVRAQLRGMMIPMFAGLAALWLGSCEAPHSAGPPPSYQPVESGPQASRSISPPGTGAEVERKHRPQRAAEERPGLATGFGESMKSPWNKQSFVRASSSPAGTSTVYYNDREGFNAMAGSTHRADAMRMAAGNRVEWGIRSGRRFLPAYETRFWRNGDYRRFVVGREGSHYSIVVKNRAKSRLELVVSVDGLDVIDGKTAGLSKRGYIIAPGETLEIHGWRTSPDSVARFRFSSVAGSYANLRHGDHRNVGVIGLAVFDEKGVDPWKWMPGEVRDRFAAQPF